jgi:hypothetical protein
MSNTSPKHYKGEIECIQCIKASMSKIEFMGYLKGNVQKYTWVSRKNGLEDLEKANVYLGWLIAENQKESL